MLNFKWQNNASFKRTLIPIRLECLILPAVCSMFWIRFLQTRHVDFTYTGIFGQCQHISCSLNNKIAGIMNCNASLFSLFRKNCKIHQDSATNSKTWGHVFFLMPSQSSVEQCQTQVELRHGADQNTTKTLHWTHLLLQ